LFHCLAEKINDNSNETTINLLITNIKSICDNLPCPICQQHARTIWNKYQYIKINTKEKLKSFLFQFHNIVNNQTKKKKVSIEILNNYKIINLNNVLTSFKITYLKKQNNSKLIMYNFHRKLMVNKFIKYMSSNKNIFDGL